MLHKISYIVLVTTTSVIIYATVYTGVFSSGNGFKETLLGYIEGLNASSNEKASVREAPINLPLYDGGLRETSPGMYKNGDWGRYVVAPRYNLTREYRQEEEPVSLYSYGGIKMNFLYGKSYFAKDSYRTYAEDKPVSQVVGSGFSPTTEVNLHMEGRVGKRLTVYIDHSNENREEENQYRIQYKAVNDDEVLREINAGDIDIKQNRSKYALFDNAGQKGMGLDTTLRKDGLTIRAFASIIKGKTEVEYFQGSNTSGYVTLAEYQFLRNTYFQLEPFKRYDKVTSVPAISLANNSYATLITFTSDPANAASYQPASVNIEAGSLELYMDDQDPYNNSSSLHLTAVDGGYYDKLAIGNDYRINYATGEITMLRMVPDKNRIFALYRLASGGTASYDPSARTDLFSGKIFVFIKYGKSQNEDVNKDYVQDADYNNDGKINYDVYEIRSHYFIGETNLVSDNFSITFYNENQLLGQSDAAETGRYAVSYKEGLISFYLREPFKSLLDSSNALHIYAQTLEDKVYDYSRYALRVDYYKDSRHYQLKHSNVIPDSVRVKIDGKEISTTLYSVDYEGGRLEFNNEGNPVVSGESVVEIRYEYLPLYAESKKFIGGVRADYKVNRSLSVGGTFLGSRDAELESVPDPGEEPTQNTVLEGDATLHLGPEKLGEFVSLLTGNHTRSVPVDFRGYVEYARSWFKTNTFGKAMIDDMEATNEITQISLRDKDWILSSMPQGQPQSDRARLSYKYYRDLSNPEELLGDDFFGHDVDYSVKPGPYNVAEGHKVQLDDDDQVSLVYDFDFSYGNYASAVTRRLSESSLDFGSLQYVEIWYKAASGTGNVNMALDMGTIAEDSDGDSQLDTEDLNSNGYLDYDPTEGIFEDRGYLFNPSGEPSTRIGSGPRLSSVTRGDGVLTSEDLNGNGVLDTTENIITFPDGTLTYIPGSATPTQLPITLTDTSWQKARIYLQRAGLTETEKDLLSKVEAIRLYLYNGAGTGKVYIDSLSFVSIPWRDIKINDVSNEDTDKFRVSLVDTYNDSEYRSHSFLREESRLYQSLYGDRTDEELDDEREAALEIAYDVSSDTSGSTTRRFTKQMDLAHYKTLHLWLNVRDATAGDKVRFMVGSSEQDYLEYEFPLENPNGWQDISLQLSDDSSASYEAVEESGYPDMRRINIMRIKVLGGSGRFWVNNIYVADPVTLKDSAYWCEGEVQARRPLYKTDEGTPIGKNFTFKYVQRKHGYDYISPGRTTREMSETAREFSTSMEIVPRLFSNLNVSLTRNKTGSFNEAYSESLRGSTNQKALTWNADYYSVDDGVPSVHFLCKYDNYKNNRLETLDMDRFDRMTERNVYAPKLVIEENIANFLSGTLLSKCILDLSFNDEAISREAVGTISSSQTADEISRMEEEARQKSDFQCQVDYKHKYFYISPTIKWYAHEVVGYSGKTLTDSSEIIDEVHGGYHLPFYYGDSDLKFVERNKYINLRWGIPGERLLAFSHETEFQYSDHTFRDYDENERLAHASYRRSKSADSYITQSFDIPLRFNKIKKLRFIQNMQLSYDRKVYLDESGIPYEGEGTGSFGEEYGVNRVYNDLASTSYNMVKYPPWYFYTGRGTYAHGRDRVYETLNKPINYNDGTQVEDYNNAHKLIDTIACTSSLDFYYAYLNMSQELQQLSERQDLQTAPQQNVTFTNSMDLSFDLMKIFDFWFFRKNRPGHPYHESFFTIGYAFSRNMFITSNIQEDVHSPVLGLTFKWDNSQILFRGSIDFRHKKDKEYIPLDDDERSSADNVYYENLVQTQLDEKDKGYSFRAEYKTDVGWLYTMFSELYVLTNSPLFTVYYEMLINRYDYTYTVSPEPYDQHSIGAILQMDVHQNVQGGLTARYVWEKMYNRDTGGLYREIRSYEVGFNFLLHF